jgi:two-component system NtrC family response regulator
MPSVKGAVMDNSTENPQDSTSAVLPSSPNVTDVVPKPKLLIIEDEEAIRTQMKWALTESYEVLLAENRMGAIDLVTRENPPVVTLDLGLPPRPAEVDEGFATLAAILEEYPQTKVIIITGRAEKEHALRAVGQGAYDFFYKPIEIDELKVVLRRAFHISNLEKEYAELQKYPGSASFEGILGTSEKMQAAFSVIQKVSATDAPVLITGESGTGKELVARAIYRRSTRKERPFVAINCGAIPETLLESELFGHEKGAFTGAHVQRKGRFETAKGGTLFLDEIGELPLSLQVKLLRFLQEQKIERVGGREPIVIDARIIAATNKDLKQAMIEGRFREDLYYRLGVVVIPLPPLREMGGDILLLANVLLERYANENKKRVTGFSAAAKSALERHSWPGNVRELENRVKRAVIMAEGSKITPVDLELDSLHAKHESRGLKEAREEVERDLIQKALTENKGNLSRTAAQLGVSRPTLYELMEKLGIGKRTG